MNTWTPSARAVLQRHLDQHRARFAADGAEADEVVADLRDHIEREASALNREPHPSCPLRGSQPSPGPVSAARRPIPKKLAVVNPQGLSGRFIALRNTPLRMGRTPLSR